MNRRSARETEEPEKPGDWEIPTDPAERRARMEEGLRESRESYLRTLREHDEAMKELGKEKGILEWLFGYRTST